jgi:hypothetical protein
MTAALASWATVDGQIGQGVSRPEGSDDEVRDRGGTPLDETPGCRAEDIGRADQSAKIKMIMRHDGVIGG